MKKVCFVCLGNICRSPMAEFVMKDIAKGSQLLIDSKATSNWEHGNPIHGGTQKILTKYAVPFDTTKSSQQFKARDFAYYDYVIGMDAQNVRDLKALSAGRYDDKIALFCDGGVPDPWYTGDFEETYALVKSGCQTWLEVINGEQNR